jgi:hypothetical protein
MRGISSLTKEQINGVVETLFDKMAQSLLGNIPQLANKKTILFSTKPNFNLAQLFLSSLGSHPNPTDTEAMKNLLSTAHSYVEALKNRTKARLTESVDSYVKEQRAKGLTPSSSEIKNIILNDLKKAGNHFSLISGAEATKARNMGKALNIAKVGASHGEKDPMVFFAVVRDGVTCKECIRLHLMPDKITPKIYRLSEVGFQYHKKGEHNPKIMGAHPLCRCTLTYLSPTWGFKDGKVTYISQDHNELKKQRGES